MGAIRCRSFFQILAPLFIVLGTCEAAPETKPTVPQQVFEAMRQSFRPDVGRDVQARYQFELSGPNGGEWWIEVKAGKFKMGRGRIEHPQVTFIASDRDWVALSNGTLSGTWATLTGRLKVHGDRKLARKLDEMCP